MASSAFASYRLDTLEVAMLHDSTMSSSRHWACVNHRCIASAAQGQLRLSLRFSTRSACERSLARPQRVPRFSRLSVLWKYSIWRVKPWRREPIFGQGIPTFVVMPAPDDAQIQGWARGSGAERDPAVDEWPQGRLRPHESAAQAQNFWKLQND